MTERAAPQHRAPPAAPDGSGNPLRALYRRPGFLIRRGNQIAVWLFLDEAAPLPITTTQYGALVIVRGRSDIDQIGLARLLCIDKSTTALVVGKLESAGYMRREADPRDRRRNLLRITANGLQILADMAEPAERARRRLLAVFTDAQVPRVLSLLERYVQYHDQEFATQSRCAAPSRA